jgi:hypothetical protein
MYYIVGLRYSLIRYNSIRIHYFLDILLAILLIINSKSTEMVSK